MPSLARRMGGACNRRTAAQSAAPIASPRLIREEKGVSDYSNPPTEKERARVRKNIIKHFGACMRDGACYVRSTETWFGRCPDCLMWVRDGHASMEAAVGVWIGRWAENSGPSTEEVNTALDGYTTALRDVFGVDAIDDLDAPYDEAPDHKGHCKPIVFIVGRQTHRKPVLKLVSDHDHSDQE
jgi:hypothetical protein